MDRIGRIDGINSVHLKEAQNLRLGVLLAPLQPGQDRPGTVPERLTPLAEWR